MGRARAAYDPGYADRGEFAAGNGRQIGRLESLGAERLEAQVKDIRRLDDGCFRLTLDDGRVLDSRQVVLGAGAGPHTSIWNRAAPQTEAEKRLGNIRLSQPEALRGKVMDLDEFMRASDADPSRFAGKSWWSMGPMPALTPWSARASSAPRWRGLCEPPRLCCWMAIS